MATQEALEAIYAAAAGALPWASALDKLLVALDFASAALTVFESERRPTVSVWREAPPEILHDYVSHYNNVDPGCCFLHPDRKIFYDYQNVSETEMDNHEFYAWKARAHGMRYHLGARTDDTLPFLATLTLHRPLRQGHAQVPEIAQFASMFGHVQLALSLHYRLALDGEYASAAAAMLDHNSNGVALLDRAGRVLFANQALRAMAAQQDGFSLAPGGITALRASENTALQTLLRAAVAPDNASPRGGQMRLPRRNGRRDYVVLVAARGAAHAEAGADHLFAWALPAVSVIVTDPDAAITLQVPLLQHLYQLTPAEIRVAERIVAGDVPKQAATALGISVKTVRDHLEMLFRKTGTRRQADLLRLLLSLPRAGG